MLNKNIKNHFEMNSRFRNGIFLLATFLLLFWISDYLLTNHTYQKSSLEELTMFQKQYDSLKEDLQKRKNSYKIKPFNPNFITEYKAYVLGLSPDVFKRIQDYRKTDKWINSTSDFQRVTQVSDSVLQKIIPYLKFPEWKQKTKYPKKNKITIIPKSERGDLNTVSMRELQESIGVPDFISERIIEYRDRIGGYRDVIQLQDIKGLYESQRKKIVSRYDVKSTKIFALLNIHTASVKDLLEIPYFDFETALTIRDFVKEKKKLNDLKELAEIQGISVDKIPRIALYLKIK